MNKRPAKLAKLAKKDATAAVVAAKGDGASLLEPYVKQPKQDYGSGIVYNEGDEDVCVCVCVCD